MTPWLGGAPGPQMILRQCLAARWQLLATALMVLAIGEVYMRLSFIPQRLEYLPDGELGGKLAPAQAGYLWLANMSMPGQVISVNSEGHRGRETDWSSRPIVLAVGDSEWLGPGVRDDEVWTSLVEAELRRATRLSGLQVVNASGVGFGPYHASVVCRRVLAEHQVDAIVVRVAVSQSEFRPIPVEEQATRMNAAKRRFIIQRFSKFLAFLISKFEAQVPSLRKAVTPRFLEDRGAPGRVLSVAAGRAMRQESMRWWKAIAAAAHARDIPVVFVIHDVNVWSGTPEIRDGLNEVAAAYPNVRVFRLGPERLGLDPSDLRRLRKTVRDTLTLQRDTHANALQHGLIARAMMSVFDEGDVIESLLARDQRRP
jgi:hypothetical protein